MSRRKGIGSHQSAKMLKDEWLTPPDLLEKLEAFDLDPCAPIVRPWDMAKNHYTKKDDGLSKTWEGRVWCNPPYGLQANKWLKRCAEHKNAMALIFARTETVMFFSQVWEKAHSILFLKGRLHFYPVDGKRAKANAGGPSVLISYNSYNTGVLHDSGVEGHLVILKNQT